jgi:hypothetical protein
MADTEGIRSPFPTQPSARSRRFARSKQQSGSFGASGAGSVSLKPPYAPSQICN